jgi:hypothetical protein
MTIFTPLSLALKEPISVETELDWHDIGQYNQVTISANEFVPASSSFPLFFTKNSHDSRFSAIALLGFQQDNVFFNGEPSQDIAYIPKSLSMLPFGLGVDPDNEQQLTLCINLQSQLINNANSLPLLNAQGINSDRLTQVNKKFSAIFQDYVNTEHFINTLIEYQLLMALSLNISCDNEENIIIKGLYSINEQQLNQLTPEQKLLFIDRGYYPPIMAMLASLEQVNRMVKLCNRNADQTKITAVNLKVIN